MLITSLRNSIYARHNLISGDGVDEYLIIESSRGEISEKLGNYFRQFSVIFGT